MRITDLDIEGFGKFHDISINDLGTGLTVLHGENEAGKSTLLSFIRRTLFGFPSKNSKCNHYPAFKGGLHGGRLSVCGDNGDNYTIERYAKGGLNVYLPDGMVKGESELGELLGNADKDVFENVYAFGLDELQDFNKLNGDSISGKLYSAGTGIGAVSLSSIKNACDTKKRDLFKPTGRNPPINGLFTKINKLEQSIKEIEDGQNTYDQLHIDIEFKENEILDLKSKKNSLLEEQEHIRSLLSVWDDWVELQTCNNRLKELPILESFPDNGLNAYKSIKEKELECVENIASLNSSIEGNKTEQGNIVVDEVLLAQKDVIFELGKGIEKYRFEMAELPDMKGSLKAEMKRLGSMLHEIGPDWDEDKLNGFDKSIPAIDAVRKRHGKLQEMDDGIKRILHDLKMTEDSISKTNEKQNFVSGTILEHRIAILNLADRVAEYNTNVGLIISNKVKLDHERKELTALLQNIGSKWDENVLDNFDLSSSVKTHVSTVSSNFKSAEFNIHGLESKIEWAKGEISRIGHNINEIDLKIEAINVPMSEDELRGMLSCLKNLRARYPSLKEKELELRSLERDENIASMMGQTPVATGQRLPMWPAGAFAVVGVAGLAAGYVYENLQGGAIACIGLFIVAGMYSISVRNSAKSGQRHVNDIDVTHQSGAKEQVKQEIASMRRQMLIDANSCDLEAIPEISVLEDMYDELKNYLFDLNSASELNLQKEKFERDRFTSSEQCASFEAKLDDLKVAYQKSKAEWSEWLLSHEFDGSLTPEVISDKFSLIREGKDKFALINNFDAKLLMCERLVYKFEDDANKLIELCGSEVSESSIDLDICKLRDYVNEEYATTGKVELLNQDYEELVKQSEVLKADLNEKEAKRNIVLNEWKGWLAKYDLSSDMTTEGILDIFTNIKSCYEVQAKIGELNENIGSCVSSIDTYEGKISSSLDACGRTGSSLGFDTELGILLSDVDDAVKAKNDLVNLMNEMDSLLFSLKEAEYKYQACLSDMSVLLNTGHAKSEDDFVTNAKVWDDLVQLRNKCEVAELHVRKLSGNENDHLIILGELNSSKHDILKVQESTIFEKLNEVDDTLEVLTAEKGSIKNQIDQLEGYNEGSMLRLELGSLHEDLNEKSREWATYSIAQHILSKAMEKYEKERQPAVITEAQSFFSNITGGRYERIYSSLDSSNSLFVDDQSGKRKNLIELSRGTAEQLYLALRFGLIKELGKHSESLPIVFDDILVNFDPVRSRNAISSINELSLSNQVLYFTCHPGTVDMFRDVVPDVRVVELSEL